MEDHLRLAEAKGSLRGHNSPVQDFGLRLMLMLDERARQRARADMVKQVVLTTSKTIEDVYAEFPEFFPEDFLTRLSIARATVDGVVDPDKIDPDLMDWEKPASEREVGAVDDWIAQHERGSVTAADLDGGWR